MTDNLKPCPFCGCEARLISLTLDPSPWVECLDTECAAFVSVKGSDEEAVRAWNRRVCGDEAKTLQDRVDLLEATLDGVNKRKTGPAF